MKVKYLATLSCLLTGSSAHAIEIIPINTAAAPQNTAVQPTNSSNAPGPVSAPTYLPRSPLNSNIVVTGSPAPASKPVDTNTMIAPSSNLQTPQITQNKSVISKPPIDLLSTNKVHMRKQDAKPLQMANKWLQKSATPFSGREGSIMFTFGTSLPSLICSPLRVCTIRLQPGEIVVQIDIGDSERWRITPSVSGSGEKATTHLMVKPTDSGLETNISIATNRRRYNINLLSTPHEWMPEIAFTYPEEPLEAWSNYAVNYKNPEKEREAKAQMQLEKKAVPQLIPKMHFNYKISGDDPVWRPLRVYSDETKTYIEFSDAIGSDEAPALVSIDDSGREQLVNYRIVDKNRYMIDKVIQQAALITGVDDDQVRVDIEREE